MEVHRTKSSTSLVTNEKMRSVFATIGLPEQVVTDNGTRLTSEELFDSSCGTTEYTTS